MISLIKMVQYDLSHLIQDDKQLVIGPIQDDEALFLYSVVVGRRCKYILEVGGLEGYSATNFLKALDNIGGGVIYTIDINPVKQIAYNHRVLTKDVKEIVSSDVDDNTLDMVFFDCHVLDAQMTAFDRLVQEGCIDDHTIIALHDTNTHPFQAVHWAYPTSQGWVHQRVEREIVNLLSKRGYEAFHLHPRMSSHNHRLPFRHGVTLLTKNSVLEV
jgi:predicted O-methyltransferase YrrM